MLLSVSDAFFVVSGIAVVFSLLNLLFVLLLQFSQDPSLHTPFYSIIKLNVFYTVADMLARTNFHFCFESPLRILVVDSMKTVGPLGYSIGLLYIEALRYSILCKNTLDERSWPRWRLSALFLIQFVIPVAITVAFPDLEYVYESNTTTGHGCYTYLQHDVQVSNLRSIIHSCFVFPSLLFMALTVRKLREFRKKKNLSKLARRRQGNLVKYTIYCAILQIVQSTVVFVRSIIINGRNSKTYQYTPLFVFMMYLGYENIPLLLLIYLSNSVRRRLARIFFCSKTTVHPIHTGCDLIMATKFLQPILFKLEQTSGFSMHYFIEEPYRCKCFRFKADRPILVV